MKISMMWKRFLAKSIRNAVKRTKAVRVNRHTQLCHDFTIMVNERIYAVPDLGEDFDRMYHIIFSKACYWSRANVETSRVITR